MKTFVHSYEHDKDTFQPYLLSVHFQSNTELVISFSFFFSLRILEKSRFLLISILLFVFPLSLLKQVYTSFYSISYPCILHIYELQNLFIFYSLDFHNGHRINRGTIPENGLYCW